MRYVRLPRWLFVGFLLLFSACMVDGNSGRPSESAAWTMGASMLVARDEFGIAVVSGRIYAIGGMTGPLGTVLNSTEEYDPTDNTWAKLSPLPLARRAVRAAAVGNTIYVIGGTTENDQTVRRVDTFDTVTKSWGTAPPLPAAVASPSVIAVGPDVYVAGGLSSSGTLANTLYVFDTQTGIWSTLTPMQTPRSNEAIAFLDGEIYVIGGDGIDGPLTSVERFNTVTRSWSAAAALPQPLMNLGAATVDSTIHVLFENSHYTFSEQMDKWNVAPPMLSPRHAFGTAVIGNDLFVVGGCNQVPQDTGVTEVLNLAGETR